MRNVYATGTFNDWNKTSTPLASEKNGYWSIDVPGAKLVMNTDTLSKVQRALSRIDPYARKVTNSVGNGIIYDPTAFDWTVIISIWPRAMSSSL